MAKADILLESLRRFFEEPENLEKLKDILGHRKGISLRNLEWFVTNYSKDRQVTYETSTGRQFTVHVAYKSSLDGYSKKLFDPFCRTDRIEFHGFTTTPAQLNFLKWCIQNSIIEYMINSRVLLGHRQSVKSHSHSKIDSERIQIESGVHIDQEI